MKGTFRVRAVRGAGRFQFSDRLAGQALRPGRYRLRGVARDAAGNTSAAARARFELIR